MNIPRQKFYSIVTAPSTIAQVVNDIYDEYGIALPLSDLFTWAMEGGPTDGIKTALRVGYAKINGVDTDQFVFRGDTLDFQVWIARGARPLPAKIAIASRDDPDTRPIRRSSAGRRTSSSRPRPSPSSRTAVPARSRWPGSREAGNDS